MGHPGFRSGPPVRMRVRIIRRRWLRLVRMWRGTFGLLRGFSRSQLERRRFELRSSSVQNFERFDSGRPPGSAIPSPKSRLILGFAGSFGSSDHSLIIFFNCDQSEKSEPIRISHCSLGLSKRNRRLRNRTIAFPRFLIIRKTCCARFFPL
jgi:hypothetical protein